MDEKTIKLLARALEANQGDWETRAHLAEQLLASGRAGEALELLSRAPELPAVEDAQLLKARVEAKAAPDIALHTLDAVLKLNRGCARAYLLLAEIYADRGMIDEARRKYGAATVIDQSLADAALAARLGISETKPKPEPPLPPAVLESTDDAPISQADIQSALAALNAPAAPALPPVTFADIGGMKDVIERVRMNIIYPFKNPETFARFKKRAGGGILMYGPPGCGKTHLARATAGECDATFMSIAVTDVLSKWLGESERHLHELFEQARRRAPTVVFIDEIDAIGVNRTDAGASVASVVNVLLTEMDGLAGYNERVMILAATNMPWRVDSALRRPGRFDRVVFVPPPDVGAREEILRIHLADLPAEKIDLGRVAKVTDKCSGADLRAIVDRAAEKVIAQEMRSGVHGQLTTALLLEAVKGMKPSTVEWLETARNYASYANRSGLYDELADYLENH